MAFDKNRRSHPWLQIRIAQERVPVPNTAQNLQRWASGISFYLKAL